MQRLLELLRGTTVDSSLDKTEWDWVLTLAEEEHILPWVAHLSLGQGAGDKELSDRLNAIQRDAIIAALYWSSELKEILQTFEQHKIVAVPLKGPFLAERLYGDAALRMSYDLDILVSTRDLTRAEVVLREIGFIPGIPDDYHRQWCRRRTTVELHHDVENPLAFNFETACLLRRIEPGLFQGQHCWQLAPRDELLFLCLHGVRHRFDRLSLILDLCLAFEKQSHPEMHLSQAEGAELNSLFILGVAMARRLQPSVCTTLVPAPSQELVTHLESLADRLWNGLLTQPSEPLDWRALHSFYVEMELPKRRLGRRLRHFRILLERVIQPDYEFAARFGWHRVWQVRLLRPLRLLRDALRKST
jgi:hypothetical protein